MLEALTVPADGLDMVADAVAHSGRDISHMQQLHIISRSNSASCLPWLLTHCAGLKLLGASFGRIPWFPRLANLKHLVLEFVRGNTGNICTALQSASALRTLHLSKSRKHAVDLGALILNELPELEVLVLSNAMPHALQLPASCHLHLLEFASLDMAAGVWAEVLCNVRSICGVLYADLAEAAATFLANCVLPVPSVCKVGITMRRYLSGSSLSKLNVQGFRHLQKFAVAGRSIHIQLPLAPCWEEVVFDVTDELLLRFHDVDSFVSAVPKFEASFRTLRNTWLVELCAALRRIGIAWGSQQEAGGKSRFWYPVDQEFACCCGGCLACLSAAGKAVAEKLDKDVRPPIPGWEPFDQDDNVVEEGDPDLQDVVHYPEVNDNIDFEPPSPVYEYNYL